MTNILNQNYKETKIRNVKHNIIDKYLLEYDKVIINQNHIKKKHIIQVIFQIIYFKLIIMQTLQILILLKYHSILIYIIIIIIYLVGEINLKAYLIPTFTATIIGILNIDIHKYLNVIFWQLGCQDSLEPFIKKLKDIVYDNGIIDFKCDRLIAISKNLFSGQEKLKLWPKIWF